MRRHELTDEEWAVIQPLLPNKPRGVPRVDDRRVLNGILWRFRDHQQIVGGAVLRACASGSSLLLSRGDP